MQPLVLSYSSYLYKPMVEGEYFLFNQGVSLRELRRGGFIVL